MNTQTPFHQSTPLRAGRAPFRALRRTLLLLPFLAGLLWTPARAQQYTWAVQATNNLYNQSALGAKVAAARNGSAYVLSHFWHSFTVGGVTYTPSDSLSSFNTDMLLVRYNADGTVAWSRSISSLKDDYTNEIVINEANNLVYISGTMGSDLTFYKPDGSKAGTLTSNGQRDAFVAQYDIFGNFKWARRIGGAGLDYAGGLDVDPSDRVYLTGSFEQKLTLSVGGASTTLTSAGKSDIFVARYSKDGALQLARRLGGTGMDESRALAVGNQSSYIYLTGRQTSGGKFNAFVARYDAQGNLNWNNIHPGGEGYNSGSDLAVTPHGAYAVGNFTGSIAFPSGALTAAGQSDLFVAYYPHALNGVTGWAKRFGGPGNEEVTSLDYQPWDEGLGSAYLYLTGGFTGSFAFGPSTLTAAAGTSDMFLARLATIGGGTPDWAGQLGSSWEDEGKSISLSNNSTLYLTGHHMTFLTLGNTTLSSGTMLTRIDLPTVKDFQLVKAATDTDSKVLASPAEINYYTLGTNQINIRANVAAGTTKSVKLIYDGVTIKTDKTLPFTWAGDGLTLNGTDYLPFTPTLGAHTLEVMPYSGANATGLAGRKRTLKFTVVNKPVLNDVTLVNALVDITVKSLAGSPSIHYSQLGTKLINLVALPNPVKVGSVRFTLDGVTKYDNTYPYSWAGEQITPNGLVDFLPFTPAPGSHTLKVTAYTHANGLGTASNTIEISFTVTDGAAGARLATEDAPGEAGFAQLTAAPNPFRGHTSLAFTAPADGPAALEVYNSQGLPVARLFEGAVEKGKAYQWTFDGTPHPAGVYFARLKAGHQVLHQRLVLAR
jgi:hypothetical protein